ncbi:hypothetical protein ACFTAO_18785 [Paenibacillus rhizoplanae]
MKRICSPSVEQDVLKLHAEGYHYVAVICKTAEESAQVHRELEKRLPVRLVTKETPNFQKKGRWCFRPTSPRVSSSML